MAGVRGGHAGISDSRVTMSSYAALHQTNQAIKTKAKITRARSGPKPERCSTTPQQMYAPLMWLAGVEGVK